MRSVSVYSRRPFILQWTAFRVQRLPVMPIAEINPIRALPDASFAVSFDAAIAITFQPRELSRSPPTTRPRSVAHATCSGGSGDVKVSAGCRGGRYAGLDDFLLQALGLECS